MFLGPSFFVDLIDTWTYGPGIHLDFIRPGRPVENSTIESLIGRLRDECLNAEVFFTLHVEGCAGRTGTMAARLQRVRPTQRDR